jgi:hypothetical protein
MTIEEAIRRQNKHNELRDAVMAVCNGKDARLILDALSEALCYVIRDTASTSDDARYNAKVVADKIITTIRNNVADRRDH